MLLSADGSDYCTATQLKVRVSGFNQLPEYMVLVGQQYFWARAVQQHGARLEPGMWRDKGQNVCLSEIDGTDKPTMFSMQNKILPVRFKRK